MKSQGLIYIFTGKGKGKTSAALGVAMRAAGQGQRAAMVQWYKEQRTENTRLPARQGEQRTEIPTWRIGEHRLPEMLKRTNEQKSKRTKKPIGSFEIYPMGRGFYKLPTDHATPNEHRLAAQKALEFSCRLLTSSPLDPQLTTHNSQLFLLVLDEALNAVNDKLISLISLIRLIRQRNATHIILTGRNCPKKLIALADLVTEMKNIKHPYDRGQKAVLGLDF